MSNLPKTFDGHRLGEIVVKDHGICEITDVDGYAGYTMETIMPKEVFIEAYNKYITEEQAIDALHHYGWLVVRNKHTAVEIPKGEWIRVEPTEEDIEQNLVPLERIECSICHFPNRHIQYDEYHDEMTVTYHNTRFCPNCGAKMSISEGKDV